MTMPVPIRLQLGEGNGDLQLYFRLGLLLGHLRSRFALVPESRGKQTRGLELLDTRIQAEALSPSGFKRAGAAS
jgi:hypothetical protein